MSACGGSENMKSPTTAQSSTVTLASNAVMAKSLGAGSVVDAATSTLVEQAVNLQDAIAILKLIVGLDVNSSGPSVTSYQLFAADFDGNGKVELADAIGVLKRVVGLESPSPKWLFFNQPGSTPFASEKLNPGQPTELTAAISASMTSNVGLVAVLRGDVVGSTMSYDWKLNSKPANSNAMMTANADFIADVVGAYELTLKVTDGFSNTASTTVTLTASTPAAPVAPTIGAATAGDASASIAFSPNSSGGLAVTYTASCAANGAPTSSGTSFISPVSVTGLTNGKSYACVVTASSSSGTSAASAAVSVSPVAGATAAPTLLSVTPGDGQIEVAFAAPSVTGGISITGYTATCAASTGNLATSGRSSPLTVTGLSNGTQYSCAVTASSSAGTSAASSEGAATPVATPRSEATSYAPANYSAVLNYSYSPSALTPASGFTSKKRYMIGDGAANQTFWATGTKGTDSYPLAGASIGNSTTYKDYLSKIIQVVVDSSDNSCFRLDPHLHSNYSLDVNAAASTSLAFSNNWGLSNSAGNGYVCFSYDSATKYLKAKKRYSYSNVTFSHTLDANFGLSNYYVNFSLSGAKLVASAASATPISLYESPINFNMPNDFNPNSSIGSNNSALPFSSSYQKITDNYLLNLVRQAPSSVKKQISVDFINPTLGYNVTTVTEQDAMLSAIEATAKAKNFKLRYPINAYKVFRDAALRYRLQGDSVVDGSVGEYTVPMIYFTNSKDITGSYHPAMIVVGYSVPDTPHMLADIIKPPGGGDGSVTLCNQGLSATVTSYPNQCVTRGTLRQNFFFRIPLKDYGLTTSLCSNSVTASYFSDYWGTLGSYCNTSASKPTTIENYASISDNGVLIDGTSIYPVLNNILIMSQEEPSLNPHGCHVGQGYGYHCHSDGFSVMNNGMSIYNEPDFVGKNHPPLIGFGYDGIALYGRYLSKYPNMAGYTSSTTSPLSTSTITGNELDPYGGHTHVVDGVATYHQHSRPYATVTLAQPGVAGGKPYIIHSLITGAWRGKINDIPNFWDGSKPNTSGKYNLLMD